jgi:IS30 family transposase
MNPLAAMILLLMLSNWFLTDLLLRRIEQLAMKQERTIARLAKAGMSTATIADVLEVRQEYIAEVLRRNPASEREQAIAELKAEGYSDERIRAVFGE